MKILEKIRRSKGIVEAVVYGRFSSDMQREEYLALSRSKKFKPTNGLGGA